MLEVIDITSNEQILKKIDKSIKTYPLKSDEIVISP